MAEISVVIPLRNRTGLRLRNCLRSLRWQALEPDAVEIVISDLGSDAPAAAETRRIAEEFGAKVEFIPTREVWNRSRALNLGIQAATARWVLCTDADMIFAPSFLPAVLAAHADTSRDAMVFCRCHDLPEDLAEQAWEVGDFPMLRGRASLRDTSGTGACQSARRSFFFHVRGYDEKFVYWGAEDDDMRHRAQRWGLTPVWITEATSMLHQWHPTTKHDRMLTRRLNKWRARLTRSIIVKNRGGWGRLP
jgi:glycosyltransferase involved in cell wall biosynthesis